MKNLVEEKLKQLGPWNFLVEIKPGVFTIPRSQWQGIWHNIVVQDYITRTIFSLFEDQAWARPADTTVLDIGCNEGWLSLLLAQAGFKHVIGIDNNPANIEKARFLQHHFGLHNLEFVCGAADNYRAETPFGIVIMLGVLNHCSNPIEMLRSARSITAGRMIFDVDAFVADTQLADDVTDFDLDAFSVSGGMRCQLEPASQVTSREHGNLVFQYSRQSIQLLMQMAGFTDVLEVSPRIAMPPHYRKGRRVMMLAKPDNPRSNAALDILHDHAYAEARYKMADGQPVLLEEGYCNFNIVKYGKLVFGIPQGALEAFDLFSVACHPECICARSEAFVRSEIKQRGCAEAAYERAATLIEIGQELLWLSRHSDARIVLAEAANSPALDSHTCALAYYHLGRAAIVEDPVFAEKCWQISATDGVRQAEVKLASFTHGRTWPMSHHLFD